MDADYSCLGPRTLLDILREAELNPGSMYHFFERELGSDPESIAMRRFSERGNDETRKLLVDHFAKRSAR